MSSEKRDLSDLTKYEGSINKDENIYEFPKLYITNKLNKIRIWKIVVRIIKDPKNKNKQIDWNILEDEQLLIKKEYIIGKSKLPPNSIGQYWITSGELSGKITRHPPSYSKIKNEGKINERNGLQTAIISARNGYLKKIKNGYKTNKKNINDKKLKQNIRFFPMLPVKYKERWKKIKYPCYVQPKLDGTRVLAYLYNNNVILYTRELKDVPGKENIKKQLFPILKKLYDNENKESLYIDFEFYKFGEELQDISSALRNEKTNIELQCWIFDIFYPSKLNIMKFKERIIIIEKIEKILNDYYSEKDISYLNFNFDKKKINKLFNNWINQLKKIHEKESEEYLKKNFKKKQGIASLRNGIELGIILNEFKTNDNFDKIKITLYKNIVIIPTIIAKNRVEEEYLYWGFISVGFEGSIVRNFDGIYKGSIKKNSYLRSMDVQKRKQLFSQEYEIFDYTSGKKGRDIGALIWIFKINNKLVNAVPKNTSLDERKKLFSQFKKSKNLFINDYKGKLMTVEFEDKSKDDIPQRLKALGLRPYL